MFRKKLLMFFMLLVTSFGVKAICDERIDFSVYTQIGNGPQIVNGSLNITTSSDGVLDKPVLIVEGLDLLNSNDCLDMWANMNDVGGNNTSGYSILTELLSEGKDIVFVNFLDSAFAIEKNAEVLQEVISYVNYIKTGDHSLAIIGLSMGGLVTRYALTSMENNGVDHGVYLFVSYDSPQKYANVPAEYQLAFSAVASALGYLSNTPDFALTNQYKDTLGMPAVKQMLAVRKVVGHEAVSEDWDYRYPKKWRSFDARNHNSELMESLTLIGNYPTKLRKVAFSNGSSKGELGAYNFSPGEPIITFNGDFGIFTSFSLVAHSFFHYDQSMECLWEGSSIKYGIYEDLSFDISPIFNTCEVAYIYPESIGNTPTLSQISFDNAPGSRAFDISALVDASDSVTVDQSYISFIPTISALDIDTNDLFYNVSGDANILDKTPFNQIYVSEFNETHLQFTTEKYLALSNELSLYHKPKNVDSDYDGLLNSVEIALGTDIAIGDTDADGMSDGFEYIAGLNPLSVSETQKTLDREGDLDGDNISNFHEYCGSPTNLDADCVSSYRSNPVDANVTPNDIRAAIMVSTIFSILL